MTRIPMPAIGLVAGGAGAGQSHFEDKFLQPDYPGIGGAFEDLQGNVRSNELQDQSFQEQQGVRNRGQARLADFGQGERGRIEDAFLTASRNAAGSLNARGFAGSSLNIPAQLGVEADKQAAFGNLQERVIQQQIGADTEATNNLSDLLFGSSSQGTDMISALLGAGGVGRFGRSTTAIPHG